MLISMLALSRLKVIGIASEIIHMMSWSLCILGLGLEDSDDNPILTLFWWSMKILNQNSKFIQIFSEVGNSWELDERILSGLEEFTCRLYGFSRRVKKVDEAREIKVKKMCGSSLELRQGLSVDLSTFPPCKRVLFQHMRRVNFQVCVWKRAHEHYPEIPSPLDHGFHINTETGKLEPLWFEGDVFPKALIDVLAEEETDEDDLADEIHTNMDDDEEEEEEDD